MDFYSDVAAAVSQQFLNGGTNQGTLSGIQQYPAHG